MMPEEFYDEEIAPALRSLATQCHGRGLSFLAVVEWEPGEFGRTAHLQKEHGLGIGLANVAAAANGNADGLILHMMKQGQKNGHNSLCLAQLGVPHTSGEKA